jgi:hypothetical protein
MESTVPKKHGRKIFAHVFHHQFVCDETDLVEVIPASSRGELYGDNEPMN